MKKTKSCPKCKKTKGVDCFYKRSESNRGEYRSYCIKCERKYYNKYAKSEKGKRARKSAVTKQQWGMSLEAYNLIYFGLLKKQNNKCAICGIKHDGIKRFALDHDHINNKYRGVLCVSCNTGLGQFKESIEILNKVIQYIGEYNGN